VKRRIAVLGLLAATLTTAALAVGLGLLWIQDPEQPITYVVVKGDTLFEIAQAHEVTVDELRSWNGIEGDRIEIDQILEIWPTRAAGTVTARPRPRGTPAPTRRPAPDPGHAALKMPPAKPCLEGPALDGQGGDAQMVASSGLSRAQVREAMQSFVGNTLVCLQDTETAPERTLLLEITAGCDGRVSEIAVLDAGDWPEETSRCVTDILGYAPFPAHDLPAGETFQYPLTYRPG